MCDTSGTVGVGCIGPLGVGAGMSDLNTTIRSLTWTVKVVEHEYQAIQHVGATWTRTNDAAKPPSLCKLLMNKLDTWTRTFSGQLDEAQPEDSVNFELVVTLNVTLTCFYVDQPKSTYCTSMHFYVSSQPNTASDLFQTYLNWIKDDIHALSSSFICSPKLYIAAVKCSTCWLTFLAWGLELFSWGGPTTVLYFHLLLFPSSITLMAGLWRLTPWEKISSRWHAETWPLNIKAHHVKGQNFTGNVLLDWLFCFCVSYIYANNVDPCAEL